MIYGLTYTLTLSRLAFLLTFFSFDLNISSSTQLQARAYDLSRSVIVLL